MTPVILLVRRWQAPEVCHRYRLVADYFQRPAASDCYEYICESVAFIPISITSSTATATVTATATDATDADDDDLVVLLLLLLAACQATHVQIHFQVHFHCSP